MADVFDLSGLIIERDGRGPIPEAGYRLLAAFMQIGSAQKRALLIELAEIFADDEKSAAADMTMRPGASDA